MKHKSNSESVNSAGIDNGSKLLRKTLCGTATCTTKMIYHNRGFDKLNTVSMIKWQPIDLLKVRMA